AEEAPAIVGNLGPVLHRVVDGLGGAGLVAGPDGVEPFHGHDLRDPIHTYHADRIVSLRPDGPRRVRAVVVVVQRPLGVIDEIPTDVVVGMGGVAVLGVAGEGPATGAQIVAVAVAVHIGQDVVGVHDHMPAAVVVRRDLERAPVTRVVKVGEGNG